MAFIGLMSPGLLTMTTLNVSIDRGVRKAVKFVTGAIIPIIFQAHIALLGAEYLKNNPQVIRNFSKIAIIVFLLLSYWFYHQYKQRHLKIKSAHFDIENSFLYGMFVSAINPLAIPFYFTYSTLLEMQGILDLHEPYVSIFVFSAIAGAFTILYIFSHHAHKLLGRVQFVAKHFKLILAIVMFVLAMASLYNVLRGVLA